MKATDLMIGDWVMYGYFHYETGEPIERVFQITQIEAELGDYYVWSEDGRMCHPELLNPIPLTPEILEKNGWNNTAPGFWQISIENMGLLWQDCNKMFQIIDHTPYEAIDFRMSARLLISAVHELQHALRLCGIEKEIVL